MSRVTYLLGAGASYGDRKKDEHGQIIGFTRGLPVVNEFAQALHLLQMGEERGGVQFVHERAEKRGVTLTQYEDVIHKLAQLEKACASYPTIDTLAKQLYVTGGQFWTKDKEEYIDYKGLKRYISAALLMMQSEEKRDLRYDGLIASLIDEQRNFPPMTILSWNYDVQFEMAYSGYFTTERYIPKLWGDLNVFNKMYPTEFDANKPFAMIKLNGTALFTDTTEETWKVGTKEVNRVTDCFYGSAERETPYQYGYKYLNGGNYKNMLSYAWEGKNKVALEKAIEMRTYDTEELIVIGYSFPYVNNAIDSFILQGMQKLKKVIVQDFEDKFVDVKERIEAILEGGDKKIEIVNKKNLQQFYIPNNFGKI